MALTIDGAGATAIASNVSSVAAAITTTQTNDILLAFVHLENPSGGTQHSVSSVSGGGLTWALRKQFIFTNLAGVLQDIEVWWATAASALTAQTIAVSFTGAIDDCSLQLIAVNGVINLASPWDANGSLPATGTTTAALPSAVISTSSASTMALGFWGTAIANSVTAGTGFTALYQTTNGGGTLESYTNSEYQLFSSAQTSITVAFAGTGSKTGGFVFDALAAGSASNAYSLNAAEGAYALSGQTQPFISLHRNLAAAEGTYALSGKGAAMGKVNKAGAYALAGQPVALNLGRSLAAAAGSYALAGQAQHFGRSWRQASGAYALSGNAIATPQQLSLQAASGRYLRTSFSTALIKTPGGPDSSLAPEHSRMFRSDVGPMTTLAGAIAGPPPSSAWSASDAATIGYTLSNGGLTVTSGAAVAWKTIRNTFSQTTGKVYVEFLVNATVALNGKIFGLGSSGMNIGSYLGTSAYSGGIDNHGVNYVSAGFTSLYTIVQNTIVNDVWALAVDFAAGSLWIARNNVWFNGSNPATGSLPIMSFVPATVGALFVGLSCPDPGETWTLQPTAASQKYNPPAGFVAWG